MADQLTSNLAASSELHDLKIDAAPAVDLDHSVERNIERTKAYYSTPRHLRGPMLTDDFVFVESPAMPTPGNFVGLAGMMTITPTLLGMFDYTQFEIKACTGGGDYTVALLALEAKALDASSICMEIAEVFLWEKGKLKQIKPHWFDIGALHRAIAAKQQWAVYDKAISDAANAKPADH